MPGKSRLPNSQNPDLAAHRWAAWNDFLNNYSGSLTRTDLAALDREFIEWYDAQPL